MHSTYYCLGSEEVETEIEKDQRRISYIIRVIIIFGSSNTLLVIFFFLIKTSFYCQEHFHNSKYLQFQQKSCRFEIKLVSKY